MSTTRSRKRRNDQQEGDRNVSEGFVSPIVMENTCSSNRDVEVAAHLDQNRLELKIASWRI